MKPIAVIGANGGVGRALSRQLLQWHLPVRLGARKPDELDMHKLIVHDKGADYETRFVDVDNIDSLMRFIDNTSLVVNCAGPLIQVGRHVINVALDAGIDVIDINASVDDPVIYQQKIQPQQRLITACGLMPGLTGALPILLADSMRTVKRIHIAVGGQDYLTPAAAADIIYAARQRSTLSKQTASVIPDDMRALFSDEANAVPYHDEEITQISAQLGVPSIYAWAVYVGRATQYLLLQSLNSSKPLGHLARRISRTSKVDVIGSPRYQQIIVDLFDNMDSHIPTKRACLKGKGASEISGAALACVVHGIIHNNIAPGIWSGADVLGSQIVIKQLTKCDAILGFDVVENPIAELLQMEEGVV